MTGRLNRRQGFTITELMVVIAVIILVLGLLFPALGAFRKSGLMTKSMANMRQIARWMSLYSSDNRDCIVPSQYNYSKNAYPGKVRSVFTCGYGEKPYQGTWTDILWTVYQVGVFPEVAGSPAQGPPDPGTGPGQQPPSPAAGTCQQKHDYRYDSPDRELYRALDRDVENPFRSAAVNTRNAGQSSGDLPKPYGAGANERGFPGFFAANNFFNMDGDSPTVNPNGWFTTSQMRLPERSMYLVDSFAGEVIEPTPATFQVIAAAGGGPGTTEVDFRYSDNCLMLFLDGHIESQSLWEDLCELEGPRGPGCPQDKHGRGIRVRNLTSR